VIARLRYRIDLALARGPLAVIGYLAVLTAAITVAAAAVLTALHLSGVNGGPELGFAEAFWQSLLRMLGKGAFASDQQWTTRVLNLVVTLTGIFLAGALIALIAASVNQRIARLRKGRSAVLETGHTLVLGWSPRLAVILSELVIANADRRRAAVVVLAEHAQDEMEDELRRRVPHTANTRLVCRTGDPGRKADLELVNVRGARSVIVLCSDDGDAGVVRAVLALRGFDPDFKQLRVVAEFTNDHYADALRTLTDGAVVTVQSDLVISQVTAQACYQDGLAGVFHDLLGFDGDEIHIKSVPQLAGHPYEAALLAFESCSLIGVCRAGVVTLDPPGDFVFEPGDEAVVVAHDANSVTFTGIGAIDADTEPPAQFVEPDQHIALIGWSTLGQEILRDLDHVLGRGSVVELLIDPDCVHAPDIALPHLHNATVHVRELQPGPPALLDALGNTRYDHAIVLSYRHGLTADQADARTMLTLLTLHRAWAGRDERPRIVAEMLDRANVAIARTIEVDDFIVSDELSSLMLAQVSERRELHAVFRDLFDASGSVLSLRPAALYAKQDTVAFSAIVAAAGQRGESALGYRSGSDTTVLNPAKSTRVSLGEDDRVLVLTRRAGSDPSSDRRLFAGRQLDVAAEGLPHGRQELVGVDGLAPTAEPGE
jgi:Trk K+ transport system NAD-binding subunit